MGGESDEAAASLRPQQSSFGIRQSGQQPVRERSFHCTGSGSLPPHARLVGFLNVGCRSIRVSHQRLPSGNIVTDCQQGFSTLWLTASIAGGSLRAAIARRMTSASNGWRSWTIFNVSAQLPQCAASRNLDVLVCASGASGFTPRRVLKQRQTCSSCSKAKWVIKSGRTVLMWNVALATPQQSRSNHTEGLSPLGFSARIGRGWR